MSGQGCDGQSESAQAFKHVAAEAIGHPVQSASRGETEAQRSIWVGNNRMANRLRFLPWPLRGCGLTRSLFRVQRGSQPASRPQTRSGLVGGVQVWVTTAAVTHGMSTACQALGTSHASPTLWR